MDTDEHIFDETIVADEISISPLKHEH